MTADTAAIEAYLHDHIPISAAFGVRVRDVASDVVLWAPFAPNINHKSTVFGGSLQAVATLAAWTLVHVHARPWAPGTEVVITHSDIEYRHPVTGDFTARAAMPDAAKWQRFRAAYERHGKGRITIGVQIHEGDALAVEYKGTFALLTRSN